MDRHASARWTGGLKEGSGTLATGSGALKEQPYSFHTRFETEPGSNPEELIGAAHAGCFSMALAGELKRAGFTPESVETKATVHLEMQGGPAIDRIHLETRVRASGGTVEDFQRAAEAAKATCPVSRVLKAAISLDARLENPGPAPESAPGA